MHKWKQAPATNLSLKYSVPSLGESGDRGRKKPAMNSYLYLSCFYVKSVWHGNKSPFNPQRNVKLSDHTWSSSSSGSPHPCLCHGLFELSRLGSGTCGWIPLPVVISWMFLEQLAPWTVRRDVRPEVWFLQTVLRKQRGLLKLILEVTTFDITSIQAFLWNIFFSHRNY